MLTITGAGCPNATMAVVGEVVVMVEGNTVGGEFGIQLGMKLTVNDGATLRLVVVMIEGNTVGSKLGIQLG